MMLSFSALPFQLILPLIFSRPLRCVSFVFTYLWSVSHSLLVSVSFFPSPLPLSPSLPFSLCFSGDVDENEACFIFSSEGAEYFSFAFSLFLCSPSFFRASLMCLWIRYHSVWMSSQTQMRGSCMHLHTHSHTHTFNVCTHTGSFDSTDQRHPYGSLHSGLFASCFHVLLHPHYSIQFLNTQLRWERKNICISYEVLHCVLM